MLWLFSACTDGTGPVTSDSSGPSFPTQGSDLVATDANVNSFSSDWVLPVSPVPAGADLFVKWSTVTTDAYGVARDADSYDQALLVRADAPRGELEAAYERGTQADVPGEAYVASVSGQTSVSLSDLGLDPADLVEDAGQSWLFALAVLDGARPDVRTGVFLEPTDGQSGSILTLPAIGPRIDFASRFDGAALRTDAGHPSYTLDFGGVTVDAFGNPLDPADSDLLFIGAYTGHDEADDLAGEVFDLQASAAFWWELPLAGETAVTLGDAVDEHGDAFPGFTANLVWLVGVRCGSCGAPVPLWVATVDVN